MSDELLVPPFTEKLFKKPTDLPEGKLEFTEPERPSDGEFLGTRSRINEEKLAELMKEKEPLTLQLLDKFGKKIK